MRDVSADRRQTWGGLRWTGSRAQTKRAGADGEIVWSRFPDAGIKPRVTKTQGDGG